MKKSQSIFVCETCGYVDHIDMVGAHNLYKNKSIVKLIINKILVFFKNYASFKINSKTWI